MTEGWMAEKPQSVRVYHYIHENTRSLCGRYGFYNGDLVADEGHSVRDAKDCAECFRRLRKMKPIAP